MNPFTKNIHKKRARTELSKNLTQIKLHKHHRNVEFSRRKGNRNRRQS